MGNIEEDVGLEPTTVLPATTFQESLLIQPDAVPLILSNMSMNSFILKKRLESFILIRVLIYVICLFNYIIPDLGLLVSVRYYMH